MADVPIEPLAEPIQNDRVDPHNHSSSLELGPRQTEMSKSPAATPWLHLEPDVTQAVIAKTEEELLSGLSALMRNKVEYEKVHRQLATALHQIEEARKEHLAVKNQIRVAEDELAARVKDHEKVLTEISRTQEQLQVERNKHLEHQEALFKTRNEAQESHRALQNILSELGETQETCRLSKVQIAESKKEITRLLGERESLLAQIHPIRQELEQRLLDRESIIEQVIILNRQVKELTEQNVAHAAFAADREAERANLQKELTEAREELNRLRQEKEQLRTDHERLSAAKRDTGAELSDLEARLVNLRFRHAEHRQKLEETRRELALAEHERTRTSAGVPARQPEVEKTESPPLPPVAPQESEPPAGEAEPAAWALLFGWPAPPVSKSWDSYVLESEFFTEENLDAAKIADLVSSLPGIEHTLILQQFGPVLAGNVPDRLHSALQVPHRDYSLLYDQLSNQVHEYSNLASRGATYQIGDEFLTLIGNKEAFLLVTHEAPNLRPGLPEKLSVITEELGKMYPAPDRRLDVKEA
ncbi:MAG: hypothetical protein JO271_05290 [Verrucomicrobia bacterium]|nr:hypothetical protein [Verrucomicrobiota bacterium]